MTDVRLPARPYLGTADDGWAIFAPPPGVRDLGCPDVWDRSLDRSRARRRDAARRRPSLTGGRLTAAVMAVSVLGTSASVDVAHATPTTAGLGKELRKGSRGSEVEALQRALGLSADGIFGPGTQRAVKAYQRAHGLLADGVVGLQTRASLGLGTGTAGSHTHARAASATATALLSVPHATAIAVQQKLGITADGDFGPRSQAALQRWQAAHGLTADGIPGPQTLAAMGLSGASPATSGSATSGSAKAASSPASSGIGAAVSFAQGAEGASYVYGATGPGSYDCSGLTQRAYAAAGISIPRTSQAQYGVGSAVSHANVQAGDLVFFATDGPGATHVGIATGPDTAISATTHGVMEHSTVDSYWGGHYVGARRVSG